MNKRSPSNTAAIGVGIAASRHADRRIVLRIPPARGLPAEMENCLSKKARKRAMSKFKRLPDGRTVLKNSKPPKTPIFVMLLKETLDSPAWKAMSHRARSLYVALRRRYNQTVHNNGRIYLAQRKAAEEIGSKQIYVGRWFRELQHYGFIVLERPGCLGVNGKGQAPKWRLTELGYMNDPPTREFMQWQPGNTFIDRPRNTRKNTEPRPPKGHHPEAQKGIKEVRPKRASRNGTSEAQKGIKENGQGEAQKGIKSISPSVSLVSGASGGSGRASNSIEELAAVRRRHDELAQLVEAALKPNGRMH
jgi:hypothetical protein